MSALDNCEHVDWEGGPLPELRSPTMVAAFAGWNDAGDASSMAVSRLAQRWACEKLGEIDPEPFFDFTSERPVISLDTFGIEQQGARRITWPVSEILAAKIWGAETDAVLLIGAEPHMRWRTFCEQVTGVAHRLGVERIITLGALVAAVPHSRGVRVYGATDDKRLRSKLDLRPSTYEGPTGIVGVLSAACMEAGFPLASFWAAVPGYLQREPSPKAALALVQRVIATLDVDHLLGMQTLVEELAEASKEYEKEVGAIVAGDDDISAYVAELEAEWDAGHDNPRALVALREHPDRDDPGKLVAEVERFLRDSGTS